MSLPACLFGGFSSCSIGGSWTSPSESGRTDGVLARLSWRSVIEFASRNAHVAKGRARGARRHASLASLTGDADDSSERGSPMSVPAPLTASISANHTPSRLDPRGPRKSDGAADVKSSGKEPSISAGVSLACGSRDGASGYFVLHACSPFQQDVVFREPKYPYMRLKAQLTTSKQPGYRRAFSYYLELPIR